MAHEHHHHSGSHGSRKTRLLLVITISFLFFLTELIIGFLTKSLALIADAFHYLNDLIGFLIALAAIQVAERKTSPSDLSFGWVRATLLGAFFNGAFLIALALSIILQSIERFISIEEVNHPKLVLIVGCVGLGLNIISALFLHEHDHGHGPAILQDVEIQSDASVHASHLHVSVTPKKPGMDLNILGVLVHVVGDAINNIGVIVSAVIIWFLKSPSRFYADPAISVFIAIMIFMTAIPLTRRSGRILLQSAPLGVKIEDIKQDIESIPGVLGVHELHVWRLDQKKALASAHIVVNDPDVVSFSDKAKVINECLHAYGCHSTTLQVEVAPPSSNVSGEASPNTGSEASSARPSLEKCGILCGTLCEDLKCCS